MEQMYYLDYRCGTPRSRFREEVSGSGGGYCGIAPFLLPTSQCGKHTEKNGTNPHVTITQLQHSSTSTPRSFFGNVLKWRPDLPSFHPGLHFEPFQGCVWMQKAPLQARVSVDEVGECEASSSQRGSPGRMVAIWKVDRPPGVRAQAQSAFPITCTGLSPLVNTSNSSVR